MLDVFHLSTGQFEAFILVLVRVSATLFFIPIFSAPQITPLLRMAISLIIAFAAFHAVPPMATLDLGGFLVGVISQALVGFIFGYVAYLVFLGVQFAGEILDLQIGFAVSNILNPITQQQITVIGELELALATLLFLVTDSHLTLLDGIGGSFNLVPLPYAAISSAAAHSVGIFFGNALLIVFKIAAPISVALFVTNFMLALMSRVAPQMNVFVVGLPIQIGVGFAMMLVCIPLLGYVLPGLFSEVPGELDTVLRELAPISTPAPVLSPSP